MYASQRIEKWKSNENLENFPAVALLSSRSNPNEIPKFQSQFRRPSREKKI